MNNEVSNYEFACGLTREQLELEIILCARNLVASKTIEDHRFQFNKISAYTFRLRELKGL